MKTFGVIICCLLAALPLSCESANQELNSIDDLKEIDFGQSVPTHSLLLLHWFANVVHIDHYNTITVTFDPNTSFGSHHYGNFEDMLEWPRWGYRYYTVGNLYAETSNELPGYVRNPPVSDYRGRNIDRIIFRAERQNSGVYRINRVYLTQHIGPSSNIYDPEHTYPISTNLLRQIRQFSNGNPRALWGLSNQFHSDINDSQMRALRQRWGENLACLGLLLFIVMQQNNMYTYRLQSSSARGPYPSYEQSSSSNTEIGECVCGALILILIMLVGLLITLAPQK